MTRHIMVDHETLGLAPNSLILSIGAVVFDETSIHDEGYWVLDLNQPGRIIDPNTVKWWLGQSEAARAAIYKPAKTWTLGGVLVDFAAMFDVETRVWSNGANFDIVQLENAYAYYDIKAPWEYKNTRCYRTVRAMFPGIDNEVDNTAGTEHNALDDARYQAHVLQFACAEKGFVLP